MQNAVRTPLWSAVLTISASAASRSASPAAIALPTSRILLLHFAVYGDGPPAPPHPHHRHSAARRRHPSGRSVPCTAVPSGRYCKFDAEGAGLVVGPIAWFVTSPPCVRNGLAVAKRTETAGRYPLSGPNLSAFRQTGTRESDPARGCYPVTTPLRSDAIQVGMAGE